MHNYLSLYVTTLGKVSLGVVAVVIFNPSCP